MDVVLGPGDQPEMPQAAALVSALGPDMLHLADHGYESSALICAAAGTGVHLLWRITGRRVMPVLQILPAGSFLSVITDMSQRIRLTRHLAAGIWRLAAAFRPGSTASWRESSGPR